HPSHTTSVSPEDMAARATRFYHWHIDATLYELPPPRVMTLYALRVPRGLPQVCRYDNGMGDALSVPLGTTAFVAGRTMGVLLPLELKSVAVRARVMYAPHPYVWMGPAHTKSTRLGLECEGLELGALPPWEEAQRKTLPVVRNTPSLPPRLTPRITLTHMAVTGELAFQVHPCGAAELLIDSLPEGAVREAALYPDGAHLTDLKEVRDLLYTMQRPAIVP
ncbi:hypothetical protein B0H14DRAFT_2206085, partial [Mycena olivaceomarginata]